MTEPTITDEAGAMTEPTITDEELAETGREAVMSKELPVYKALRLIAAVRDARVRLDALHDAALIAMEHEQERSEQLDWCLRRLPEDVQADFDAMCATKRPRWDL